LVHNCAIISLIITQPQQTIYTFTDHAVNLRTTISPLSSQLQPQTFCVIFTNIMHRKYPSTLGYWHQRAGERHDNPPPR